MFCSALNQNHLLCFLNLILLWFSGGQLPQLHHSQNRDRSRRQSHAAQPGAPTQERQTAQGAQNGRWRWWHNFAWRRCAHWSVCLLFCMALLLLLFFFFRFRFRTALVTLLLTLESCLIFSCPLIGHPWPLVTGHVSLYTEQESSELFCICRTPYDPFLFYICCDNCELWFHGSCVNITPQQVLLTAIAIAYIGPPPS